MKYEYNFKDGKKNPYTAKIADTNLRTDGTIYTKECLKNMAKEWNMNKEIEEELKDIGKALRSLSNACDDVPNMDKLWEVYRLLGEQRDNVIKMAYHEYFKMRDNGSS